MLFFFIDNIETGEPADDCGRDRKRLEQIRRLENTLKKLNRAICKLEEEEVDFDDEEDSVYLLTDRWVSVTYYIRHYF